MLCLIYFQLAQIVGSLILRRFIHFRDISGRMCQRSRFFSDLDEGLSFARESSAFYWVLIAFRNTI
jgi:hypothetical protein